MSGGMIGLMRFRRMLALCTPRPTNLLDLPPSPSQSGTSTPSGSSRTNPLAKPFAPPLPHEPSICSSLSPSVSRVGRASVAPTKGSWDFVCRNGLGGLTGRAEEWWRVRRREKERQRGVQDDGGMGAGENDQQGARRSEEYDENQGPEKEIRAFVLKKWRVEDGWETAWFANPPGLQSVPGLAHFHFNRRPHAHCLRARPGAKMDCLKAVQAYVDKVVTNTSGIKVLLLDADTTPIVSLATTQSHLLSHEVYLTDRIDNPARHSLPSSSSDAASSSAAAYPPAASSSKGIERLPHLKCVCFLRPTEESIEACERELRQGRFGGYWLYFTNVLSKAQIERLAEADEHELVKEVQEYFCDYSPLTSSHFSLSILPTPLHPAPNQRVMPLYGDSPQTFSPHSPVFQRHLEGLTSVLLSLKKRPIIRYERMSPMARRLGQELVYQMNQGQPDLWEFRKTATAPLLLILDRRNDPVTPLLTQWTYQAMVHELLGITNGRVSLADAPDVRDELKEIVLSPEQDQFFAANLYDNFGDLGAHLSAYVQDYSTRSASSAASKIETVQDMKRFIDEYPEFRKLGSNVSKHVALVGELSRLVNVRHLLQVSELEQSLASNESHGTDLKAVREAIIAPEIPQEAKLRLAVLYALRYQKMPQNQIAGVVDLLKQQGVPDAEMVHILLNFAGADQRQDDLFGNENFFSKGKSALKGLKGVDNVYTQHTPHLMETIDLLLKGRLKESSYPYIDGQNVSPQGMSRPQDIILFIVGGTTYEEAKAVAQLNAQFATGQHLSGSMGPSGPVSAGTRIILGGTCVHNSKSFLTMVRDAAFAFGSSFSAPFPVAITPAPSSSAAAPPSALSPPRESSQPPQNFNLSLGPIQLNVGGQAGNTIEAGVDAARDGLRDVFGKIRSKVDGVRL
ncbi:Vacuolar protein sorting-associated protein 45 [Rhodotorula toruloides]|nr:Vacuolar protein sorting-associated protein 45 [Rhodotorula toruloides]